MKSWNFILWVSGIVLILAITAKGAFINVAVSTNHFCALVDKDPKFADASGKMAPKTAMCWNRRGEPFPVPENLEDPNAIVAGSHIGTEPTPDAGDYTCVIDKNAVKCSGYFGDLLTKRFRDLRHPILISAGSSDICVVDDSEKGLNCYGGVGLQRWTKISDEEKQFKGEKFVALDVGTYFACGVTATGSRLCRGGINPGYLPQVTAPLKTQIAEADSAIRRVEKIPSDQMGPQVSVSVGLTRACSQVGSHADCWGLDLGAENENVFEEVDSIDASIYRTCVIQKGLYRCIGKVEKWLSDATSAAQNFAVAMISNKEEFNKKREVCLVMDKEIVCRGSFNTQVNISLLGFELGNIEQEIKKVAFYAYQEKADILDRVPAMLALSDKESGEAISARKARLFTIMALGPLVSGITSPFFRASVIPRYSYITEVYKSQVSAPAKVEALNDLRDVAAVRRLTLSLLEAVVESIQSHILLEPETDEEKSEEKKKGIAKEETEQTELNRFKLVLIRTSRQRHIESADLKALGISGEKNLENIYNRMLMIPRYVPVAKLLMSLLEFAQGY